ncbi:PTS N-acetylgalactosamine transporter subunit IID, partial [Klebsiella pneumoniae]|nr:PTS N-acetylgalactosamine transporter subunit IID [Klebsiella pneumoniae]
MAFNDSDDLLAQKAEQRMAQALATSQVEQDDYLDSQPAEALTRGDINRMAWRS